MTQTVWLAKEDIKALGLDDGRWHLIEISGDGLVKVDNEVWGFYDWRFQ